MNMNELYALESIAVSKDLDEIKDHIYESGYNFMVGTAQKNTKILIKVLASRCPDKRRVWKLYTVWYNGIPFTVTQNAGREGDDFIQRYISDYDTFAEAINYIRSLDYKEPTFCQLPINPSNGIDALTHFYEESL